MAEHPDNIQDETATTSSVEESTNKGRVKIIRFFEDRGFLVKIQNF